MHFFNTQKEEIQLLLSKMDKTSVDELFRSIPGSMVLKHRIDIPDASDELTLKRDLQNYSAPSEFRNFIGAGSVEHFIPEWVSQQLIRAEWYTPYTPYQPEVSQGNLQAIFEFQTLTANLLGQPLANSSMYDGATSLVEAILLAHRVNKKHTVLIPNNIHPHYLETVKTYLEHTNLEIKIIDFDRTKKNININQLCNLIDEHNDDICCAVLQVPNFFGLYEDIDTFQHVAKQKNIFTISVTTDISALSVIKPLGHLGFDVSVADGIGFCGPLSMGGPSVGIFATTKNYLRQLPGRIVGQTVDKNNNVGYVLTLSTREQHIRRENATSNICTNHNLMALALVMTLTAYGKKGFIELGLRNVSKANILRKKLRSIGFNISSDEHFYNETIVDFGCETKLDQFFEHAMNEKIIPGLKLSTFYPNLKGMLMVCTSEMHTQEDIDSLIKIFSRSINGK